MQLNGIRAVYSNALRQARSLGRGDQRNAVAAREHSADFDGDRVSLSQALAESREQTAGQGLTFTPSRKSIRQRVAGVAGKSYTDEAKLRARARQIEHTLRQIQSFQSVQSGLGPV